MRKTTCNLVLKVLISFSISLGIIGLLSIILFLNKREGFAALPGGSWRQTCGNGNMTGTTLNAVCKSMSGRGVYTSLNMSSCPTGTANNSNGTLKCDIAQVKPAPAPNVVGWADQFGQSGRISQTPTMWYYANGSTNGTLRLRGGSGKTLGSSSSLTHKIVNSSYAVPDIYVELGAPYTGDVTLEFARTGDRAGYKQITTQTLNMANTVFFGGANIGQR